MKDKKFNQTIAISVSITLFICIVLILNCIASEKKEPILDISKEYATELSTYIEETSRISIEETTELVIPTQRNIKKTTTHAQQTTSSKPTTTKAVTTTEKITAKNTSYTYYTEQDAIDIAKVLYRECRGVPSKTEQACVAWTILNRADKNNSSIRSIITAPNQFAFSNNTKLDRELLGLAYDVLNRWSDEKDGIVDVGRVLPCEYLYFEGRNGRNHFRNRYNGNYDIWDYSLPSPYES